MDDLTINRTERQDVIINYLIETLGNEGWAVAHGEKSTGKTTIAWGIAGDCQGRALIITPVNIKRYQWEWMIISDNHPDASLAGALYPAGAIYPALATLIAQKRENPLLLIIDNAHSLKQELIPTIIRFRTLLPAANLLLMGAFSLFQRRRIQRLHPAWMRIPAPDVKECEETIAFHAGLTAEAFAALPRRFVRRMVRRCKGDLRLLSRTGWGLRQMTLAEEGGAIPPESQSRWVMKALPAGRRRALTLCCALLVAGGCALGGWQNGDRLSPWLPALLPSATSAPADNPAPLTAALMSTNGAIGLLYQVWGYEVDIKEAWCDQAWRANLACQSGTESLETLEAQGLPWIAPLDLAGKTVPVVVIGEHGDELIALTTQRTWRIKKSWFSSVWRGRYTLLWKPSPDGKSVVNKKSSLEEIVWLDTMLSRVLNLEAEETGEWSPLLQEKIRQFQAQKALTADGVMGQLSLIRLWQALGESPAFIHEEGNK